MTTSTPESAAVVDMSESTAGVDVLEPTPDVATPPPVATATSAPVFDRIVRRAFRRPLRWALAPWPNERIVRVVTAAVIVGSSVWAVVTAVHPRLIFTNNTATGGDLGAQVMAPAYLRDHLLPNLQLTGWSNDWYAGMPWYRFYMVLPGLLVVLLNFIFPYGVAFKIVTVIGVVTIPFCCWCFGRLANLRYPTPELLAGAGMLFVFDNNFTILGGNLTSTMAGEFSFSMSLSLAILALGLFAHGLRTGRFRSWTAIVIAAAALSHGIVLLFVFGAAVLLWLVWMDRTRLVYGAQVLGAAVLLSAFWVVPFLFNHEYMTDMKYRAEPGSGSYDNYWSMFFPGSPRVEAFIVVFALIGFIASLSKRHLVGAWLGVTTLFLIAGTYAASLSLPIIGLLWNPRVLPFYYLCRILLMTIGLVEFGYLVLAHTAWLRARGPQLGQLWAGGIIAGVVAVGMAMTTMTMFQIKSPLSKVRDDGRFTWGLFLGDLELGMLPMADGMDRSRGSGWAEWNFTGYEGDLKRGPKPLYREYKALVDQMTALGIDPAHGCGRALWENNEKNGSYGTTMALMLLPHWTDGCISSMEGLYFEASGTTPYHFLTAAAMSAKSSNPVRELRYTNNDAEVGVEYLQTLGVKYVMVFTEAARNEAALQPELSLVAEVGPWDIYAVAGSEIVEPLTYQPVVVNERSGDQRERNLELGTSWFQNRSEWAAMPADDGPAGWQRIDVQVDATRDDGKDPGESGRQVDVVVPADAIEQVALPAVAISNIDLGRQDLEFTVDQVGVPVLVKMSYFPNWKVDGAEGPYRIAPNLMVVVPTDTTVRLHFERSMLDHFAYLLTIIGIAVLVWFRRRGDVVHATANPINGDTPTGSGSLGFGPDLEFDRYGAFATTVADLPQFSAGGSWWVGDSAADAAPAGESFAVGLADYPGTDVQYASTDDVFGRDADAPPVGRGDSLDPL
jgi:hypothetical protein